MTNKNIRRIAMVALPVVSAGIIGGAALVLAGSANAGTYSYHPDPRPGIVATPQVTAQPAPNARPGHWWHHHHPNLLPPQTAAGIVAPFN